MKKVKTTISKLKEGDVFNFYNTRGKHTLISNENDVYSWKNNETGRVNKKELEASEKVMLLN